MKNLSLNAKFIFVLMIFIIASIVISVLGINQLASLNSSLDYMVDYVNRRAMLVQSMESITNNISNQEKNLILEDSAEGMHKVAGQLTELENSLYQEMDEYRKIASEEGIKTAEEALKYFENWKSVNQQLRSLAFAGRNAEAVALARGGSRESLLRFQVSLKDILQRNLSEMSEEVARTDEIYKNSKFLLIGTSGFAIVFGVFFAFIILRAVNKAIDKVIADLSDSSNQVTSAAQQIASSSEELSQGATEQASSLEETSSAVEEMNSMVAKNAESARQSTEISRASANSANKGKQVVQEMRTAMADIDSANSSIMQQTTESNQKISEIVKVIGEIGNKTKVINEIVFQTKLLSFNASVEAARAGEHGKGFAVVAEEVGSLAQMSGNAAKEITAMLDSSIEKVEGIVNDTKSSVEKLIAESKVKVEQGTKVANNCADVLEEIVENVNQVNQLSQSISTASDEQARGISEITKAVGQLDQTTQQGAAASEETASSAEELAAQAESMQAVVQVLIQTIKGQNKNAQDFHEGEHHKQQHHHNTPAVNDHNQLERGRVLHLGSKKPQLVRSQNFHSEQEMKWAAGGDSIPSDTDPRFKDL
ncbi:MAG: HAMP domain-containing methyl-accepting chemotaxis protein [Oligoflexus sp.]